MRFNRCFETYSRGRNVIFRTRQEITPLSNGVKMSSGDRVNYAVNRLFTMLFDALCLLFTVGRGFMSRRIREEIFMWRDRFFAELCLL